MKKWVFPFHLLLSISIVYGQNIDFLKEFNCKTYINESYGQFPRNKFDILIPGNDSLPKPLVVYIHGGGFLHGDKNDFYNRTEDIKYFLKNNIAVAAINYRFYKPDDSLGVNICLQDVKRAIQYIRHNASKYKIDKTRIGCYGESAGAGSSLYLAFHDDWAIPGDTTLLGESTRIKCAGAISTQATYNVFSWQRFIPWFRMVLFLKREMFYNQAANFYGFPDFKSFKKHRKQISAKLDMLEMIDSSDCPVYLINLKKESFPANDDIIQHHKNHAKAVSKKLNTVGVINYLNVYQKNQVESEKDINYTIKEFLVNYLIK